MNCEYEVAAREFKALYGVDQREHRASLAEGTPALVMMSYEKRQPMVRLSLAVLAPYVAAWQSGDDRQAYYRDRVPCRAEASVRAPEGATP
jgi:hypothetical protein